MNTQPHESDSLGMCFSPNSLFGNPAFPDESFHPRIYTFYETGENKKEMRLQGQHAEATKKVLDGEIKRNHARSRHTWIRKNLYGSW